MTCAWHRQVRLASLAAAKHTPRKRQQEQHGKPNRKRGGAEPSPLTRLGIGCRFFRRARLSFIGFYRSAPLEFAFSVGAVWHRTSRTSTAAKSSLKTLIETNYEPSKEFSLLGSFAVHKAFPDLHATILALSR